MVKLGLHRNFGTVLQESLVVGLIFAVLFYVVSLLITVQDTGKAVLVAGLAGVLGHWAFELLGLNELFCDYATYKK